LVDFGDVGDKHCLHAPRGRYELAETTEELVVHETVDDRELTLE
jgi:hypothetical protein